MQAKDSVYDDVTNSWEFLMHIQIFIPMEAWRLNF